MPIKNGERFLSGAIKFLEENLCPEDEILLVNDNSTDNTGSILEKWSKRNSNVSIINNPKSGIVAALNLGLNNASHDWIARFDVDDRYPSSRINETKKFINEDVVAIFSDYQFTSNTGIPLGFMPCAIEAQKTYLSLVTSQRTAHPSVCFNKWSALEVGGYRSEDFPAEDLSLWLRMSKVGKIKSIPLSFLKYRLSGNSITGTLRKKSLEKKDALIGNFSFDSSVIENCVATLDETKLFYLKYDQGHRRYLLHLRDLTLVLQNRNNSNSYALKYVRDRIYQEVNNYPAALGLYGQMLVRKMYRQLKSLH